MPPHRQQLWANALAAAYTPWPPVSRVYRSSPAQIGLTPLMAYQRARSDAIGPAGGVLNGGTGVGKTLSGLAWAAALPQPLSRLWIVCPLSVVGKWKRLAPPGTVVVSIDSLHKVVGLDPLPGGALILDEAHYLGSIKANRTAFAHQLRLKFDYCCALTGTLQSSGMHKALSVLDLAVPGGALFPHVFAAGAYFNCLVKKSTPGGTVTTLGKPSGANYELWKQYLSGLVQSYTLDSSEVQAESPVPQQDLVTVNLEEPWDDIDTVYSDALLAELSVTGKIPNAQSLLHTVCQTGVGAKLDWLLPRLSTGESHCVFAQYTDTMNEVGAALKGAGISYVRVDGSVTGAKRDEAQEAFQTGKVQVILAQIVAGGIGVDMHYACKSVTFDLCWRPDVYVQMLGRTRRLGQSKVTTHWDLVSNPIQAAVLARLRLGLEFDNSLAEYQAAGRAIAAVRVTP